MVIHSLSTILPFILIALALTASVFAVVLSVRAVRFSNSCASWVAENNLKAFSGSKTAELENSLTELWDSHASLLASHKRLRSKYGMRDLRERKANGPDDQPQLDLGDEAEKAAYKSRLRLEAKKHGLLR